VGSIPNNPAAVPVALARGGPILVTGANGFLGSNVVWTLRRLGLPVRALVRRPPRGPQWNDVDEVDVVRGDVCDPVGLARAMEGVNGVIHNAACLDMAPRPNRLAYHVNVEGTRNVCAAALHAGVRRLVFTSSLGTIQPGSAAAPADEGAPYVRRRNSNPYHISKRLAEGVIRNYAAQGLETTIFCTALILGPRDQYGMSNQLVLVPARYPCLAMPPGGTSALDVREAAMAHVRALWMGPPGGRYILAGPYVPYVELANLVKQIIRSPVRVQPLPHWTRAPGSWLLALVSGLLPTVPNSLSVPNFRYGYVDFHLCGELADRTFGLVHRPISATVLETLRWFQDSGLAPWLKSRLIEPKV
jgi:dihydroflavonol-4-reductase